MTSRTGLSLGPLEHRLPLGVQADDQRAELRKSPEQTLLREEHRNPRVFRHEAQPLPRQRRIQRNVGRARFQDPEKPNDEIHRALQTKPDETAEADSPPSEMARQLIGPRVCLRVSQPLSLEDHRQGFGRPPNLLLEEEMDALITRIVRVRRVPFGLLSPLGRRQDRKLRKMLLRIRDGGFQERLEVTRHPRDRFRVEEIGAVTKIEPQTLRPLGDREGQIELCGSPRSVEATDRHAA